MRTKTISGTPRWSLLTGDCCSDVAHLIVVTIQRWSVLRFDFQTHHGVNFTNILQAAFMHADPKSAKNTVKLSVFLALSKSEHVKAARKMLMKLNR